jgi:hypothetical protein
MHCYEHSRYADMSISLSNMYATGALFMYQNVHTYHACLCCLDARPCMITFLSNMNVNSALLMYMNRHSYARVHACISISLCNVYVPSALL